ncbi:MAG: PfkB family carbohydrate kinase [Actinomycetota bacterium]|nr:PfkB family carbohydrate kinase [Actinomycetota bacterium]MDQ2955574.1 PfkB family carbohydrate kinase [Actinomycetota bacterium]
MSRIVCLGDLMVDVLALLPGPLVTGSDVPAPISFSDGGSAANTAAWLAELGADTVFAGRVGADAFGQAAVQRLRDQGVTTRVSIDPSTPTGVCLVLISPDGERTMVPSAGANGTLSPADLSDPPLVGAGDRLHLSGYALLNEGSRAAARHALAGAVEAGVPVSVDAASAAPIRALGGPRLLEWLPAGALLIANTDELAAMTDDDPAGPTMLAARGFTAVIKDGPRGASLVHAGRRHELPTEPVPVLDSTGAGDAFAAGLLAALHGGEKLLQAVAAGNRAGARALRTVGGRPEIK